MDKERRQEPRGRLERQGAGLREGARHEFETSSTRGRQQARLFLCEDGRSQKEEYERQDRKRPQFED